MRREQSIRPPKRPGSLGHSDSVFKDASDSRKAQPCTGLHNSHAILGSELCLGLWALALGSIKPQLLAESEGPMDTHASWIPNSKLVAQEGLCLPFRKQELGQRLCLGSERGQGGRNFTGTHFLF